MHIGAGTIAPAGLGVLRIPPVVINTQCRHKPCALFQHLRDGGIVELKSVLDRIAAAVERAMQADAVVGMASDLFAPAVSLIANCFDFIKRKRGLGVKFALFIDPGAVRHIYLDPISAMIELFAGSFARFYRDRKSTRLNSSHLGISYAV